MTQTYRIKPFLSTYIKFYQKNIATIGMRKIGEPEDVAKLALFLASDLSSFITGQIIGVDGGMII